MICYTGLFCRCDECGREETFDNPKGYDTWLLRLKAMRQGWYIPYDGRTRCPKCHADVAKKAGVENLYGKPFPHAQGVQKGFDTLEGLEALPAPPKN